MCNAGICVLSSYDCLRVGLVLSFAGFVGYAYLPYFSPQRARIRSAIFASWAFCSLGV